MQSRSKTRARPLDVHKKLRLLAEEHEVIVDDGGNPQQIVLSELRTDEASAVNEKAAQKKKLNIPTPMINEVDTYEKSMTPDFKPPVSYIRMTKKSDEDSADVLEYNLEHKDVAWLQSLNTLGRKRELLDEDKLELMLDILEKATGTAPAVSQDQAETILMTKLGMQPTSASREVVADVYQYWIEKRAQYKKPLLRRFWPVTGADDTNPHLVFRPREKERYKLRKHRKNDMESFRRMQQLRRDCERVRNLLDLVRHREKVKQISLVVNEEVFEQQMHDLTGGSAEPRPLNIDMDELRQKLAAPRALTGLDIEKKVKRSKKNRKRALDDVDGEEEDADDDGSGLGDAGRSGQGGDKKAKAPRPSIPSFMEPYGGRTTYELPSSFNFPRVRVYSGEENDATGAAAAAVATAASAGVGGGPDRTTPISYSCRGRIGRGGRVIFDRMPICRGGAGSDPSGAPAPVYPRVIGSGAGSRYRRLPSGFQQELRRKVRVDPQKIHHVYNLSDSEDEDFKPGVSGSSQANLGHGVSFKFELRV